MTSMRAQRRRHSLASAAVSAAAVFALSGPANAMEEVTSSATNSLAAELKADFEADMASYARTVALDLRNTVLQNLTRSGAPTLRLARATESHRG